MKKFCIKDILIVLLVLVLLFLMFKGRMSGYVPKGKKCKNNYVENITNPKIIENMCDSKSPKCDEKNKTCS